jgi:hypothetical protein
MPGECAVSLHSLIGSVKLNGLDPEAYAYRYCRGCTPNIENDISWIAGCLNEYLMGVFFEGIDEATCPAFSLGAAVRTAIFSFHRKTDSVGV